ncbi:conserved hypothetical protein [Flavobacterium sp. 9AF]|uniref:hypothetical protein n=1 Tax=Flavobacterium sp. 9AF TaxID=2653142 RepID=UPI0012F29FB1|nr:hypothetical protein [Flavobacterium sp. 9AF]VXB67479.1 conserved hypothetical protein [Flavobacterium sp. 9AF]
MHKFFLIITEIIGWIQIALSPTLIGLGFGGITYYYFPNITGMLLGTVIATIGLILGIILASKKWKNEGTISFLSNISATPEINTSQKEKKTLKQIK